LPISPGRRATAHSRSASLRRTRSKKYIKELAAHHKTEDFKSELERILRAHSVAFDERYVFD